MKSCVKGCLVMNGKNVSPATETFWKINFYFNCKSVAFVNKVTSFSIERWQQNLTPSLSLSIISCLPCQSCTSPVTQQIHYCVALTVSKLCKHWVDMLVIMTMCTVPPPVCHMINQLLLTRFKSDFKKIAGNEFLTFFSLLLGLCLGFFIIIIKNRVTF